MTFWRMRRRERTRVAARSPEFEALINAALAQLQHLKPEPAGFSHDGSKRSLDATLLAAAARERGLEVQTLTNTMQVFSSDSLRLGFFQNMCWTLTALDRALTNNKQLTKVILRQNGLPVAEGSVVTSVSQAIEVFQRIGRPVAVKPIHGSGGRGVTVDVRTEDELTLAVSEALDRAPRVLVEESVPSVDLRVMVVAGRTVATMMRVPANVVGDGVSTVEELIRRKNRLRAANAYLRHVPIKLDDAMLARLTGRGLSLSTVIAKGERVFLHYKANLGSGGDSLEVTGQVHPSITEVAERALACFTSAHHGGIDLLVERLDAPADQQRVVVCEVNCNNDMPIHVFPLYGKPVSTGHRSIDGYFFSGRERLPESYEPLRPGKPDDEYRYTAFPSTPDLVNVLANPVEHQPGRQGTKSPRRLDRRFLSDALRERGYSAIRHEGRLIRAEHHGVPVVFERRGSSVFIGQLAENQRALGRLLSSAGVDVCPSRRFTPDNLDGAAKFVAARPGPWLARPTAGAGGHEMIIIRDTTSLQKAWPQLTEGGRKVTLRRGTDTVSIGVLLIHGEHVASLAICPAGVVGDGTSTVDLLLQRRSQLRKNHPYLRHMPAPELAPSEVDTTTVPAPGTWLPLSDAPYVAMGGDTIGLRRSPVPLAQDIAARTWEVVGRPRTLAVHLVARSETSPRADSPFAVMAIDRDPILAEFAFPYAGEVSDVYAAAADALERGQQYRLGNGHSQ